MALALGFGSIPEARAPVAEPAIVEDLNLPALEKELAVDPRRLHDLVQRLQSCFAFDVERYLGECVAVSHLVARQPSGQPLTVILEQGMDQAGWESFPASDSPGW